VYISSLPSEKKEQMVSVASKHIDGSMGAPKRDELLGWLKAETTENECRVLTNVRCLSEGVDVPSLDAVLFLSARNSQVDVVQSVGRVMRKAPGKKYGYIIIPVVVPSDVAADKALDDNERYKVVWTVLNALRAHDDRFNATVNKIELNKKRPSQILVGTAGTRFDDPSTSSGDGKQPGDGQRVGETKGEYTTRVASAVSAQMAMRFEEIQNAMFARMVLKVGDRRYWEQWAKDVAQIAEQQGARIARLVADTSQPKHQKAFADFLGGLQKNINPSISQQEAIEMLAQHIITRPVFEALFEGYSFVKSNPISVSMQAMLDALDDQAFDKDTTETLQRFYDSVKKRAADIDNAEGKQRIIIELYDKFFKTAFPKMVEKLGIVYTPLDVVDFIIHSVNDVLKKEFDRSLSEENIHILDPFTGTGTFITRLLQSGLIDKKDLPRKYHSEIHANEIVLLAYYIAAVNIENAYHDALGETTYSPFEGICLTDTFQLGESDGSDRLMSEVFPQNSERVKKQKNAPLRVIIGNPPYSVGQKSANDNAQNQKYPILDSRIAETYAALTNATNKNSLYDSYIKAFRWSTDRLSKTGGGIICFVSNGAWIDGNSADGIRKSFEKEFTSVYVFNLRGNQRTSGELSRKEGGKIFGSGSRTPISITLLVKNPNAKNEKATVHYYDIGDYLSREEKLDKVKKFKTVSSKSIAWEILDPNEHSDWISQRSSSFETFIPLGDKETKSTNTFFVPFYSNGVKTQRDPWCYNSSTKTISNNIQKLISNYNIQREAYIKKLRSHPETKIKDFITYNSRDISWTRALEWDAEKNKDLAFSSDDIRTAIYRPFFKQNLYFTRRLNEMVYQIPKLFPVKTANNFVICISGNYVLISNITPDLHFNGDTQAFPLYYYEEDKTKNLSLFDGADTSKYIQRDGISNFILEHAQKQYGKSVTKEDIFYYVYGFLHSPEYRETFASDLKKMLPRLPLLETVADFWAFSKAGRKLADLHINYETVPPCPGVKVTGDESGFYRVEKMRFPKKDQKHTIHYNSKITLENIPDKAYEYVVNGKSAIEWVMERYAVTTHKESGITNDPNDWAEEVGNPRYILDLLLSVINVSVQTVDIVAGLPKVSFE
jgi:predicted helicase